MTKEANVDYLSSIILLTDFSDGAKNAIKYAIKAFGEGANYQLVNSYYARTSSATLLDLNDMMAKESLVCLEKELKWVKAEFPALNLKIKTRSIFGSPVDAIKKIHKESAHEMVVMGTKGASGIDAVLFGSVASTVIRTTVVPVISVPSNYEFNGFNEIVFATDGVTDYKSKSLEPIQKLQAKFKSQVTVFSVNKEGEDKGFMDMNVDIKNAHYSTVESNDVATAVTSFCKEKNANLLVLLPKHTGFFDRLFHKSVSKELVEQAQLPILSLEND